MDGDAGGGPAADQAVPAPRAAPLRAPTPKQQLLALLNERFPPLAKIAHDSPPDVVSAAAKRWTAILLAESPHPHEKDAAALEQSLRQLISAPLPLGLGELLREDEAGRATFEVTGEQGGGNVVVRLACPQLLALAQAMAAPRLCRPATATPAVGAAAAAAAAVPAPNPAATTPKAPGTEGDAGGGPAEAAADQAVPAPRAAPLRAPTPKQQLLVLLNERFPALAKIAPDSPPDVVSAAAKRWTAILLAESPHPHEKDAAALEQSLRQLISAPLPLSLGELLREDEAGRATFDVTGEQGCGGQVVRLACPQLLALAQAMAAPRPAATSPTAGAAVAAAAAGPAPAAVGPAPAAAAPKAPTPKQQLLALLNERFPALAKIAPDSPPDVVSAAAKRWTAILLAEGPHPHEKDAAALEQSLRQLISAPLPLSLGELLREDEAGRATFDVTGEQGCGAKMVRLACPQLLALAQAMAAPSPAATGGTSAAGSQAAVRNEAAAQCSSNPWVTINARFPPVARVNPDSPAEVVAAAAKRRMVTALAEAGPPYELPEQGLACAVLEHLYGARLPRSVSALASEAPGAFQDAGPLIRLVSPELVEVATAIVSRRHWKSTDEAACGAGAAGSAEGRAGPVQRMSSSAKYALVWPILNKRFRPVKRVLLPDATPNAVAAAAKRWMAMLLFKAVQTLPYHTLPALVLEERLMQRLHVWTLPEPVRMLASAEPETFAVSGMDNGEALISLACPRLLRIAQQDSAAAGEAGEPHTAAASAGVPTSALPPTKQAGIKDSLHKGGQPGPAPVAAPTSGLDGLRGSTARLRAGIDSRFGTKSQVAMREPDDVVASVAKRWMALVLTEQLPPHELREVALARAVSHRLGGTRALPRSVAALAAEDPATFRLSLQAKGEWAVRLVCPRLMELAAGAWAEHASQVPAAALAGGTEAAATGLAESSGSSSSNGGGGAGAAGMGPGHKKLMWRELNGRFPPVAELSARSPPEAVVAGAKRRLAALLAEAPAPHELSVAELERALPPLLGGAALTTTVAALATEGEAARGAFRLAKLPSGDVVRLVCPALLRLAEGLGPEDAAGPAAGGSSSAVAGATLNGGSTAAAGWSIPMPIPVPVPVPVPEPGSRADAWAAALASLTLESAPLQAEASSLPYAAVQHISDPWSAGFAAMLQHCQACAQVGLAVQPPYGRPELVSLYVPPTADGAAAAAVYLLDCAACEQLYGGRDHEAAVAAMAALLAGVRQILENDAVAKIAHGGRKVAFLEAFCGGGARASPLLDTRVVVAGMGSMLGLRPPPSLAAAPSPAALLAALAAHVGELRAALAATGLWADRPELLDALVAAQLAALRDEAVTAAAAAAAVPQALQQQQAAAMSRHLPELWAALAEGWWWFVAGAVEGSVGRDRVDVEAEVGVMAGRGLCAGPQRQG
ncbi:hypothetical protein HYH03_017382 [Edaphochlamys debaryana]|uniref:Uncharacterized protein n=1 Tax=Edaphochlamys debaryana TaxID=47281 RepID=A0A835XIJ8_9CHLO|nr:hypothetical protein HYH03_017382 [Edaphochlamys debaryana]|eukprot:KAG2483787.1 hypothetical protein HYH03_017382 [Edaphochlamys debaryana]